MIVDARGHRCPVPSLRLRVTLLATDPMARIDVPHLMAELGGRVISIDDSAGILTIEVETRAAPTG